ncbi:hypothetical protein [Arthrobacter sp. StoSoilA2]|uniref:hypothetical protein n=1 Tax=Arthrobacter sp. StoSoilA2 TaxID=2830990 RepID=UPI001CC41882|nr:hypothetical protein [Arthrobacter sp. StoSoilA2]
MILGLISLGAVRSSDPVYWTQADVTFVAPDREPAYWIPGGNYGPLVDFAAMVERRVNSSSPTNGLVLSRGTLYGAGVRDGYSVTLPNSGGQWAKSFSRPVLTVQVVDSSADRVNESLARVINRINTVTLELQRELGVRSNLITTVTSPSSPEIIFGGGTQSNRIKGAVVWVVLAGALSTVTAVLIDRTNWPRRRTESRTSEVKVNAKT